MKRSQWLLVVLESILIISFSFLQVFAESGENASSPGILGQKPLNFCSITLEDGSEIDSPDGLPLIPKFKLTFDKNVVNMLCWENNSKCFSLYDSKNKNIPLLVTKIDDTVDFSQRQNIFVQPAQQLLPATEYTLKISPDLRAKNGVATLGGTTSGKGVTVTFKTQAQQAAPNSKTTQSSTSQKPAANSASTQSSTASGHKKPSAASVSTNKLEQSQAAAAAVSSAYEATATATSTVESSEASVSDAAANTEQNLQPSDSTAIQRPAAAADSNREATSSNQSVLGVFFQTKGLAAVLVLLIIGWVAVELFIRKKKQFGNKK